MMQHGECGTSRKNTIAERHRGCIASDNFDIGVAQPRTQGLGEPRIGFDGSEVRNSGAQDVSGKTGARPRFENVCPEVSTGKHPRHSLFEGLSPVSRAAKAMMQLIHGISFTEDFRQFQLSHCRGFVLSLL